MADQKTNNKNSVDTDEPPKKKVSEINLLWVFLSPYKSTIFKALIALVVAASATLIIPQAIRQIIDQGFTSVSIDTINLYFLGLLGIAFILAMATFARYYLVTWLGERVVTDIRSEVFAKVLTLSPIFFEKKPIRGYFIAA